MSFLVIKGHYDWNSQSNTLEFISDKDGDGYDRKRKSRSGFQLPYSYMQFMKDRNTPSKSIYGATSAGNPSFNRTGQRNSPRLGYFRNDTVTLDQIKSVALDEISREKEDMKQKVSPSFINILQTDQFNNFLVNLLLYFESFLQGIDQQKKPHKSSFLHPSKKELKAMEETRRKMSAAKRHLGQAYCILLLGKGTEGQHHMGCGTQRVSATHRDQRMYEDLYTFCTNVVYVTFKRREYHRIHEEMGEMLRSSTFNPAQRKARPLADDDDSSLHRRYVKDPRKPISERIEELLAVKLPSVEKITPAAYRRQYGKRPAIMKAIHQRSTALVSLLPLPVETSEYLFKATAGQRKAERRNTGLRASRETVAFDFYNLQKVGIIGEPIEMFNPDLTPKNVDNDDDADSRNTDSSLRGDDEEDEKLAQDFQRTISRATTEASIPI